MLVYTASVWGTGTLYIFCLFESDWGILLYSFENVYDNFYEKEYGVVMA